MFRRELRKDLSEKYCELARLIICISLSSDMSTLEMGLALKRRLPFGPPWNTIPNPFKMAGFTLVSRSIETPSMVLFVCLQVKRQRPPHRAASDVWQVRYGLMEYPVCAPEDSCYDEAWRFPLIRCMVVFEAALWGEWTKEEKERCPIFMGCLIQLE